MVAIAAGAIALSGGGGTVPAFTDTPAGADPAGPCSTGVIVAVDFAPWGKDIHGVCDMPVPANAALALVTGKFQPTGVAEYGGLGFICPIAGDPRNEGSATTPPGNAYWSFWYAKAGSDSWTYSQSGPENLDPKTGSAEGWVFGGNSGSIPPRSFPLPNAIRTGQRPDGHDDHRPSHTTTPTTATSPPARRLPPPCRRGSGKPGETEGSIDHLDERWPTKGNPSGQDRAAFASKISTDKVPADKSKTQSTPRSKVGSTKGTAATETGGRSGRGRTKKRVPP